MQGFGTRDELALAVLLVLTFSCHVVGGWVGVFGVGPMFLGSTECAGDDILGIIDLFCYKLKKIRETSMSIYSNQGCIFS